MTTPARLYIDLDGVLADFDGGHERAFGVRPSPRGTDEKKDRNILWQRIRQYEGFWRTLPLMVGAEALWHFAERNGAVILSGASNRDPIVHVEKRLWVRKHFGPNAPLITCPSDEKWHYARVGDVLLDDWPKYKPLWENAGKGIWVTFYDYVQAIETLREMGYD